MKQTNTISEIRERSEFHHPQHVGFFSGTINGKPFTFTDGWNAFHSVYYPSKETEQLLTEQELRSAKAKISRCARSGKTIRESC